MPHPKDQPERVVEARQDYRLRLKLKTEEGSAEVVRDGKVLVIQTRNHI